MAVHVAGLPSVRKMERRGRARDGALTFIFRPLQLPELRPAIAHPDMTDLAFPKLDRELAGPVTRDLEGMIDAVGFKIDTARRAL